ncbi:SDR family oxidoreductase [Alkalimarinus coralli]|uniref:SDR family oxidoreductase n=1 Tax=Alkalimarinus coralli TaxID=2935863 RepID=UPI00202B76C9|nr:SDR family oxidoreductase [Alkalimarinus coralli]
MSKVVLITGATSGMGKETALLLAKSGYTVYAGARSKTSRDELEQEATSQGLSLKTVLLDVCDSDSVANAVGTIKQQAGRIDALVNNAGFGLVSTVEDGTDEEFIKQFDVNVFGVFRLCRAVLPIMREQRSGVIINVSSFLGKMGLPLLAHYNASKYAVEGITDSLRYEVAPFGIRVNSVLPGLFKTNFVNKGLVANQQTMAEDSPYQKQVSHFVPIVAQKINEGPSPVAVANTVKSVLEDDNSPISTPVGAEAETFLPMAKQMTAEAFEQEIKKTFSF